MRQSAVIQRNWQSLIKPEKLEVEPGADPSRVATQGYGPEYPVASNGNPGGRQLNRRVEIVIGASDNRPIAPRS